MGAADMSIRESKFKVGDWVVDTYWPSLGVARVVEVLRTRIYVKFPTKPMPTVYDRPHEQFLKSWDGRKKK